MGVPLRAYRRVCAPVEVFQQPRPRQFIFPPEQPGLAKRRRTQMNIIASTSLRFEACRIEKR